MLVQVGPVASSSVTLWVAYARTVLGQHMAHPDRSGAVDPALVEQFEHLLDDWDATAAQSTEFVWTQSLDADAIEVMARSFFDLVSELAADAERRGFPISPAEGDEFYWAVVNSMLDGLTAAGGSHAEVAADLAARWPGRKDD
jgi:hypothetical protein